MSAPAPRRRRALLAIALLFANVLFGNILFAQVSAPKLDSSVDAFLHSIYGKAYLGKDAKGIDISTRAKLDRYFVPELVKLIDADATGAAKRGDIGELDGDVFVGAQDWRIDSFDINVRNIDADNAAGTIKFSNSGSPAQVVVTLKRLKVGWRIADIDWGGDSGKLSALFHAH